MDVAPQKPRFGTTVTAQLFDGKRIVTYYPTMPLTTQIGTGARPAVTQERLLIVDDEPDMCELLALKLKREGYDSVVAGAAREARTHLAAGGVDLVLLDIGLPDGSGFDLLLSLRAQHSPLDLPIIIISGRGESESVVRGLQSGANDYLTKPFDLAIVLARVRAQLALRELKRANDRFLRIASHDLRKPLALMLDVARQLKSDYPVGKAIDTDAHSALDLLMESGDFMQHIIGDLIELRAIRDGRLQLARVSTDVGAIVRQAVARNSAYARNKDIGLAMHFAKDLPHVYADDARIMQVLENLIGNAIKFASAGAQVDIATRSDGDTLLCEVSDTGPGIAVDEIDKLFIEYAHLSNRPTGGETSTGLGLAISRELVHLHGGTIGARNNDNRGATFWFRLPLE